MKLRLLQLLFIIPFFITLTYGQEKEETTDIKGTITSASTDESLQIKKNEAIIGAPIKIKGTGKGTVTDVDGNFKLTNVPVGAVIEVSYSGFRTLEFKIVPGQKEYSIALKVNTEILDEVIVVGYVEQKAEDVVGAVKRVTSDDMKSTINTGLDQALQGRGAGINVTQTSGSPGAAASVNIRGVGSVNGTQPLYVVDGVPVEYSNINMLNPNDIETMDVLKDASAAAIYGSRGANGVVMITTKRGKDGKSTVEFDAMVGVQNVWKKLDVLSSDQFKQYYADYYSANQPDKNIDFYTKNLPGQGSTNWQDEVIRQGKIQNYNLSARGGNKFATYAISLGYFQNTGVKLGSDYDRYSLRINSDITPKKWLKFSQSLSLNRTGSNSSGGAFAPLTANPLIPVYDPNNQPGGFGGPTNNTLFGTNNSINPVAQNQTSQSNAIQTRVLGNVFAEADFGKFLGIKAIEGLKWKTNVGIDLLDSKSISVNNPFFAGPGDRSVNIKSISDTRGLSYSWLLDNIMTYNKKIKKDSVIVHDISVMAGISSQYYFSSGMTGNAQNYPTSINTIGAYLNPASAIISGEDSEYSLLGYIGRFNYIFKEKYLLTANVRYDGSSRFGANNRSAVFPSLALGWRINNENFLKDVKWITELKLRAGYGMTGNQDLSNVPSGNYKYDQLIYPDILRYVVGDNQTIVSAQAPTAGFSNKNLKWETVTQWNAGLDFSIFSNSLTLTVDWFLKQSSGVLFPFPLPSQTGISDAPFYNQPNYFQNIGKINNSGLELALTYKTTIAKKIQFSVTPNAAFIRNEVISLDIPGGSDKPSFSPNGGLSIVQPGLPIGAFYGWVADGIIQNSKDSAAYVGNTGAPGAANAHPGDIKFKDLNGDGKIDDKDRTIIGKPIPSFSYGLTLEAKVYGFDIRIFFQGVEGVQIYNSQRAGLESMNPGSTDGPDANQLTSVLNHWTPENHSNDMPRVVTGDPNQNGRFSTRFVEDGSYMRLKNLQIGYSFPASFLQKALKTDDLGTLRIYIQSQNLVTLTAYKGFDPELATYNANGSISSTIGGVDGGNYPQQRTFSAGLQVSF